MFFFKTNAKDELLFIFVSVSLWAQCKAQLKSLSQCQVATDFLNRQNFALRSASEILWTNFAETCEDDGGCPLEMEEIFTTTNLDFDVLVDSDEYKAVEAACEDLGTEEFPTSLCTASSELLLYNDQDDQNGEAVDDFYVKNEPVCFPYQCTRKQIEMFHSAPLGCDPETMNCLVYHLDDADCGNRPEGAGVGNCAKYSSELEGREEYQEATAALQAKAGMDCIKSKLSPDTINSCDIQTKPVPITMGKNFRSFEDNTFYNDFVEQCSNFDGLVCHMSSLVTMKGQTGFIDIDLTADYNDYPICLPKDCSRSAMELTTSSKIGDEIVLQINRIVENHARRKLLSVPDFDIDVIDIVHRRLDESDSFQCPLKGLTVCDFLVSDFYCVDTVDMSGFTTSSTSPSSSAGPSTGFLFAALTVAAGILF